MDDNKRVLLAFAISFLILIFWRVFILKPPPPPPSKPSQATPSAKPESAPARQFQTARAGVAAPEKTARPAPLTAVQGRKAEEITIEDDLYRVTLSTQGAVVKSWILKKYRDEYEKPLDVVNQQACEQLGFPMGLRLSDEALSSKVNSALYVARAAKLMVGQKGTQEPAPEKELSGSAFQAPASITFTYSDGRIQVQKRFTFDEAYQIHAEVSVFDGQNYLPLEVGWSGGFGDFSLPFKVREASAKAAYGAPGNISTISQSKLKGEQTISPPFEFAGLEDRYFVNIFLPDSPDTIFRVARRQWNPKDWTEKEPPQPLEAFLGGTQPKPLAFRLFVAPKDLDVLRADKPPLDGLVDFGWFTVVAKPLFLALRYVYDHRIHNWGWAIVILTIIINLALFPLKLKSIRSAQEMQKVAPIVKGIQDKYKQYKFNDPRKQKMNQEIMKIYQEHGINPLGGCLPMVLQLPLLYGFWRVLDNAIELRHAPWILWIKDLSEPDHYHLLGMPLPILPTLMIVTMFILQRMTPMATADPAQKRMMMIMPLAFGVIFFNLASGLVLYYLTANLVGIGQQMLINRFVPGVQPAPQPPAPPAGRSKSAARKPVGVKE